jgi:RNA polymerase sigma-70 factor (ECF subfamily)
LQCTNDRLQVLIGPPKDFEARKMIDAITSGDRAALTSLYMSYYGYLSYFLSQFIGSDNGVEDIVNDTFMTIWEMARGFPLESKVSVSILHIAHRHACRFVECHTPHRLSHWNREGKLRDPGASAETHRPLRLALRRLPADRRVVLMLCYRMGYSAREIALITDSQVQTVERRMFQARGQLRRYLTTQESVVL